MSTGTQMLLNGGDTEGLFHGAFMESGSPLPVANLTRGQVHYDAIVAQTNCTGSADTLACLRGVPYATLKAAADAAPGLLSSDVSLELTSGIVFFWCHYRHDLDTTLTTRW